jgi:hypothetical protein
MNLRISISDYDNDNYAKVKVSVSLPAVITEKIIVDNTAKILEIIQSELMHAQEALILDDHINPFPKDEPCCDEFIKWAKDLKSNSSAKMCPFCAIPITKERREKYFKGE